MKIIKASKGYSVKVDDADFEWLSQYKWYTLDYSKKWKYVVTKKAFNKNISMHRMILGLVSPKIFTDHIDGDGLNNQRSNLRTCTPAQNMWNKKSTENSSSKYLGVFKVFRNTKKYGIRTTYIAYIGINYRLLNLGSFKEERRAAIEYDKAAIIYHSEFANLNILKIRNHG